MRYRANGGFLGPALTTNTAFASGVWSMPEFQQKLGAGTWPTDQTLSYLADPNFEYVTMLLKSVGANTAWNYTMLDSSASNLTVTRNGDVTQGAFTPHSVANGYWSAYFDGNGDYLNTPTSSAVAPTGDFTIEMWFYGNTFLSTNNDACGLFYIGDSAQNFGRLQIGVSSTGLINWYMVDNSGTQVISLSTATGVVATNTWYHIACVKSGTTFTIYLNGTSVATTTSATSMTYSANIATVGIRRVSNLLHYWNGHISNVRLTTNVVYTTAFTPPTTPLTAISGTSLLTCQSNRFIDNSTNAFTITRNGDTKASSFGPVNPSTAYSASIVGGSLYFDGTGDYLTSPYSTTNMDWYTAGTDYTIEAWIYPTTLTGWTYNTGVETPALVGNMDNASTSDYWSFGPLGNGTVRFYYYNGSAQSVTSSTAVVVGQWNHIAMTKTAAGITIFVNGVASTTTGISGTPQSSSSFPLTIGRSNASAITGYVSNLRIIKGDAIYSGNFTLPIEPLTATTNTKYLLSGTNAGIIDASRKNDLYSVGNVQTRTDVYKFTKSMYFDGVGDYVMPPTTDVANFGTGDFTIEGWVYKTTSSTNIPLISNSDGGGDNNYFLLELNSSNTAFQIRDSSSQAYAYGTAVSTNTWTHVAVTRTGGSVRVFINGTSGTPVSITKTITARKVIVGGFIYTGFDTYLTGYIEDLRVTKSSRYTSSFTPPTNQFSSL